MQVLNGHATILHVTNIQCILHTCNTSELFSLSAVLSSSIIQISFIATCVVMWLAYGNCLCCFSPEMTEAAGLLIHRVRINHE